jgi:hypothetical protein
VLLALSPTATQTPSGDKMPETRNRILEHLNQYLKDLPAQFIAMSGPPSQLPESLEDIQITFNKKNTIILNYHIIK